MTGKKPIQDVYRELPGGARQLRNCGEYVPELQAEPEQVGPGVVTDVTLSEYDGTP